MADIFVSYSRADRARVSPFIELLVAQGWSVWWDRALIPGHSYETIIDDEITRARCVLVFWSEHSVKSDWVLAEANDGLERQILIPIMLDKVRVPLVFRRKQSALLIGWPKVQDASEIQRVIDAIGDTISRPVNPVNLKKKLVSTGRWQPFLAAIFALFLALGGYETYRSKHGPSRDAVLPITSITVLPFDDANSYSGISFEIADRLRDLEDFYVTSRNRTVEFAANQGRLKLDTRYLLKGSISESGALRVRLLNQNDEMWSMAIDIDGDDLSGVAEQVARKISETFGKTLPTKKQQIPQQVYLQYLQAKAELRKPNSIPTREKAKLLLQQVVNTSPRFAEARAGLCEAYIDSYRLTKSGDLFEKAEKQCHRAQTLADGNGYVHIVMARLYAEAGENELALEHLDQAQEISPFSTLAMRAVARVYLKQRQYDLAEDILLTAISIEPNYWANYQRLAVVYFRQGKYKKAADYFEHQTELVLDKAIAYADKGAAMYLLEDFDKAIEAWEQSLSEDSSNVVALTNLGSAYFFNGQFDEATDRYKKALELRPDHDRYWSNVGDSLKYQNKPYKAFFTKAIELAEDRLAINPDDAEAISGLAVYHATLESREDFIKYSNKALLLAEKDVYTVYDLAVARARLGDNEEAVALLERLVHMGYSRTLIDRDANFTNLSLE